MTTLSEARSKELLQSYGIPLAQERVVASPSEAATAAQGLGFPVVVKLCGDRIAHKTERGLVRLRLQSVDEVLDAAQDLLALAKPEDGDVSLLVAEMVRGNREFIVGIVRDPTFGPCVMCGVGGIFAEALEDVAFRVAPLSTVDAHDLLADLATQKLLGEVRGEAPVDREALVSLLVGLGQFAVTHDEVESVDCNPVIIRPDGAPVVVDALIELRRGSSGDLTS